MRTVTGRTDRVVVVGAGLGGLACALHLAGAGRQVTVLEREPVPGGRAGRLSVDGYEFDTGPTVLTMPDLIAEALGAVGEELRRLARPDPARPGLPGPLPGRLDPRRHHRHRADGRRDRPGLRAPRGRRLPALRRLRPASCGSWSGPTSSTATSTRPPTCSPRNLLRLLAGGGFRPPPDRRSTSSSGTRAPSGSSPSRRCTPAWRRTTRWRIYAVIAYLDSVAGVYFPRGGIHAVPRALAGAAEKHGVADPVRHHGDPGRDARRPGHRRCVTADGERIPADVVVLNPDLPVAYRDLLPEPAPAAPAALLAVLRRAARRLAAGLRADRPPQHPLRTVVAGHVRRGDPTGAS